MTITTSPPRAKSPTGMRTRRAGRRAVAELARLVVVMGLVMAVGGAVARGVQHLDAAQNSSGVQTDARASNGPGGWVVAGSRDAAALGAAGTREGFVPTAAQVDTAVAILTQPDAGRKGLTGRWTQPVVSVHVALPESFPTAISDTVDRALAWLTEQTGTRFVRTQDPSAPFHVVGRDTDSGYTTLTYGEGHAIVAAKAEIGCCRERIIWEEIVHGAGPLGDHADSGSLFSEGTSVIRPTAFDAWLLNASYRVPAGSGPQVVRAALDG